MRILHVARADTAASLCDGARRAEPTDPQGRAIAEWSVSSPTHIAELTISAVIVWMESVRLVIPRICLADDRPPLRLHPHLRRKA